VQEPAGRGFGTSLIERMLKRQHNAEVGTSYPSEGVRCEIVLPL
jgi:two-component sensor histidine kinase